MSYAKKIKEAKKEGISIGFAICSYLLWNKFGKIHRKKTRLKNFADLYL